jgi:8-oxo-dGTP pyrophosphatase MutT (NUDIX family)
MKEKAEAKEKVAAGGLVVNDEGQVLLVHRARYDDWSFPKGGVEAGETIEQAGLREVREEAGLECRIVRRLSSSRYLFKNRRGETRPKVVHYFLMKATGGQLATDNEETDQARWCSVEEAADYLSYQGDKDLLGEIGGK